jgi:hypothetical protein
MRRQVLLTLVLLALVLLAVAGGLALLLRDAGTEQFDERFEQADRKLETLAAEIEAELEADEKRR